MGRVGGVTLRGHHGHAPGHGPVEKGDPPPESAPDHAVRLVQALGEERAVIIGHDWGAPLAWSCVLLRPDLLHAIGLLTIPYRPRADPPPAEVMKLIAGEQQFYPQYFQEPGKAETEFEADVRTSMLTFLYTLSGDAPPAKRWRFMFGKDQQCLDRAAVPETLPAWLTVQDSRPLPKNLSAPGSVGAELVPEYRQKLGIDAVSAGREAAATVAVRGWRRRCADYHGTTSLR